MANNVFQYGGWNSFTLQCATWLRDHDIEFASWQHPAMWHWLWDVMPLNSPKRPPYWNSNTYGLNFDHVTTVDMSFCTSLQNFIQIGPPSAGKNAVMSISRWRMSAILDFKGPIMGSLKSPCTTCYMSSIETIALNCLVFEKIVFLKFFDRRSNRQTDIPVALRRSRYRERRLNKVHRLDG